MTIFDILQLVVDKEGSDIHIIAGTQPTLRIHGVLTPIEGTPSLTPDQTRDLITPLLTPEQQEFVEVNKELDFGYQFKELGRFRVNVYSQRGSMAASLRLIPSRVKTIDELQLPPIMYDFCKLKQGLVLVTGPTGEGKSTTLAAMIEYINTSRSEHILTIEDPIEFVYTPSKSIVSQRELNADTHDWSMALRSALREDPDIVLVGELRDYETMAAAITVAETGHLVFGTLHTTSASQTIDRIIDVFPAHQQSQIRQQLAASIQAVVSQRLLPSTMGGRVASLEIMVGNSAVRNLIREGKTFQLDNVIQTSSAEGMMLFEAYLYSLIQRGSITTETAREYTFRPDEFERLGGGSGVST
jgi:twitching motility protein PilT